MTLPTGRRMMKRVHNYGGFTLIEALLVITILSLIATLGVPRFKNTWNRIRFDRALDQFTSTARFARDHSIHDNRIYRFVVYPDRNRYRVEYSESKNFSSTIQFQLVRSRWGVEKKLPDDFEISAPANKILFFPSGASSGGRFEFNRKGEDKKTVLISVLSGQVSVETTQSK